MADWYSSDSAGAQQRVRGAWSDAPVQNAELLGFLLNTARTQVIEFGEESIPLAPPVFDPEELTFSDGTKVTLSRTADIVTMDAVAGTNPAALAVAKPIPAAFQPRGNVGAYIANSTNVGGPGAWFVVVSELPAALGVMGVLPGAIAAGPWAPFSAEWLADPAGAVPTIPDNWVLAQLMQARNLWNAGRTTGDGEVGPDGFTFRPMPLDKTIRLVIRPIDGKPHAL